jgi:hypothetical protein
MDVMEINKPDDLSDIADLGLSLTEAKLLLAGVRRDVVAAQARAHAVRRPKCRCGGGVCHAKDYHAVAAGTDKETMRCDTLRVGAAFRDCAAIWPETAAPAIAVTLDSTFIRSCEDGERHLEVRVANVETKSGGRQVFGAVARSDTDIKMLIRRNLDAVGRTDGTALTDGCPGLPRILADAGVAESPILDWFYIGMRLQHLKQIASALLADDPTRVAAKPVIVAELERLHWRIWNGKAKNARKSIDRIRALMSRF